MNVSLVIFTCEGRDHLIKNTIDSFHEFCNYKFDKIILAIDGPVSTDIAEYIKPDYIIQSRIRKGYVNSIDQVLRLIDSTYFFWLEDDWNFNSALDIPFIIEKLNEHKDWGQIVYSKFPSITEINQPIYLEGDLYKNPFGFSANPCVCRTKYIQQAFFALGNAVKGDKLGEDGFENFLTNYFDGQGYNYIINHNKNGLVISHTGYIESTARNWHMTNSLDSKTKKHLLTISTPSIWRRLLMFFKLFVAFLRLGFGQLFSNKLYEYCFRIISSLRSL